MGDWINNNWTIISYIFWIVIPLLGIIGFINAIFSLKDRWKKWRATKSAEGLKIRLLEINTQIIATELHRQSPAIFFLDLLRDAYYPTGALLGVIFIILWNSSLLANLVLDPSRGVLFYFIIQIFGIVGIFFLIVVLKFIVKIRTKTMYFFYPNILEKEAKNLLAKAEPLGLVIDFDIKYIKRLLEQDKKELPVNHSEKLNE